MLRVMSTGMLAREAAISPLPHIITGNDRIKIRGPAPGAAGE
jgi:hypothetical protein